MKTLVVKVDDELMVALQAICDENHMDPAAATNEAVRRYVAAERAHSALGSSELVSLYSEFSNADIGLYAPEDSEYPLP